MEDRSGSEPGALVLPLERATGSSALAEDLRTALLSGVLPPGTPLRDADIVTRTGAPRTTVRRALAELARDGLVIHTLHRGIEVTRITPADVRDIYAARRVFESAGLDALVLARPVDVTWLEAAVERMGEAAVAADGRAALEADIAFHLAIVAAAGAHRLTCAAQTALTELRLVLSVADRLADDLPGLVADHQHLVDIFRTGRLRRARSVLQDHLLRGEAMARAAAAASEAA
jgi:DNA-binding GntR family transcriptional regulator